MEKKYVPEGVFLTCDKGTIPCQLSVTFNASTVIYGQNLATEADKLTGVHVKPMGMCAATQGPCVPAPLLWSPLQNDVIVGNNRLLLEDSKLQCSLSGRISIFFSMAAAQAACATLPPEKSLLDQADDYLATLGPAGDYMRFQMGVAEGLYGGGKSMVEGLWGLAKGGWHAATHPVETAQAVGGAASSAWNWASQGENWSSAANAAGEGIGNAADWASHGENWSNAWDGAADWASQQSPRDWGKITGRATFEVGMAVGTGGAGSALNVAGKAGEAANLLGKAGEAANLAGKSGEAANLLGKAGEVANLAEKAGEVGNAAGKAEVVGIVTNGAEDATTAARAARQAEEASQAAKTGETVDGAAKSKRTCKKDPIDVATGAMLLEAVDLELPGPVPFVWERTWYSNSARRGPLGYGWHHSYDQALWLGTTGEVHLRLADGRLATFEPLSADNDFCAYHRGEQLELRQLPGEPFSYQVFNSQERLSYYFALISLAHDPATSFFRLHSVSDAHTNALVFAYTEQGYLRGITDSVGRSIGVRTDVLGRITAIDLPHPSGAGTFAAVQYRYDELGNLTATTDAEGHTAHYAYEGRLLVKKTFREGTSFYFEYDGQARCTRTWGDENYYNGRFIYAEGHTILLSEEPAARHEYFHHNGLVTRHIDPLGALHEWYYNPHGELELARDPLGRITTYDYDAQGNQTGTTYPDGTRLALTYNEQRLLTQAVDVNGNNWQWEHNQWGQVTTRHLPDATTTHYRYNDRGLVTEVLDANAQLTHLRYNAAGQLTHLITPGEQIQSFAYDALGRLTSLTNALGHVESRAYDLLGQLVRVKEADGVESALSYDGEGNIVYFRDARREVRFSYTAVHKLASRWQAGVQVQFTYNREGQLLGLRNEEGQYHEFVLDAAGRVITEIGFDKLTHQYSYDAAGRPSQLRKPSGRLVTYAYDTADRLTEVAYAEDERVAFAYRADGLLTEATTADATTRFEYDALGRVLCETQDGHVVESRYDAAGRRSQLTSSLGAAVAFERDAMGRLTRASAGDWQQSSRHNAQGLEVQRFLSGGLQTTWQYDALGRPTGQLLARAGRPLRQRRYQWQTAGSELTEIEDTLLGATSFRHDALGALVGARYADDTQDFRVPDAVGNLFRTTTRQDRVYGPGGQLRQANGTHYRYDAEGNLVHKQEPDGKTWHYAWNGAGQLVRVTRPDGYAVTFGYDGLGRRIFKRFRGQTTRWVWDGDRILHEWRELAVAAGSAGAEDVITWLFEEERLAPYAKLTARGYEHVLSDQLGTPLALYQPDGQLSWQMELDIYGAVRQGRGKPQDCPFRYPGQYEDVETGLYYNRFRYYDPVGGQYISPDPIGLAGGRQRQGYVADPLTQVDVFGLSEGSGTLGNRMVRAGMDHSIAPFPKSDFRAHHVIPHEVWTNNQPFFDNIGLGRQGPSKAFPKGLNPKDAAANGVFLPKSEAIGQQYGFENYHNGSHATFNADMRASVVDVRDRFNSGAITRTQARKEISALQKAERKRLSKRGPVNGPCDRLM